MKGQCDICGKEIEINICCDGYMCGCMGRPTEPPVCSKECFDLYMAKIHPKNNEKLTDEEYNQILDNVN